jgi:hypothetical protein
MQKLRIAIYRFLNSQKNEPNLAKIYTNKRFYDNIRQGKINVSQEVVK